MIKPIEIRPAFDDGTVRAISRLTRAEMGEKKPPAQDPFVKIMRTVHDESSVVDSSQKLDIKV